MSIFKGYRTLVVNGLVFLFALAASQGWTDFVPDAEQVVTNIDVVADAAKNIADPEKIAGGVTAAVALVNIALRLFTTTPAGKKTR